MNSNKTGIVGPDGPLTKLPKTFPNRIDEFLFCGLDLGIGSCGQALLCTSTEKRIIRGFETLPASISFLGVRAFDVPEVNEKSGVKLKNPERREKRLVRRTIARRADRMKQVRRLLIANKVLPPDYHCMKNEWRLRHEQSTPWQWRLDALTRVLPNWEWAVILMHYAKRRGFKSARKGDIAAKGSKGGTLDSTRANHEALASYQTVAQMFENDSRFTDIVEGNDKISREVKLKRNKDGNYKSMVLRADLVEEIRAVFAAQREQGSPYASVASESEYLSILNEQKPMQNPIALLGDCPFLPREKRTTSFAPSFELSRALQRLNTITLIRADGSKQLLSDHILSSGGYGSFVANFGKNAKISWGDLRKFWHIPEAVQFKDVREGGRGAGKGGGSGASEKDDFCNRSSKRGCAAGTHLVRNVIGEDAWSEILRNDLTPLDDIAFSLAFYEVVEDADSSFTILGSLASKDLPLELLAAVRRDLTGERTTLHEFKGACSVSSKVCRRLIPHLMEGMTYDKAMKEAGFCHTDTLATFKEISNPVVKSVIREVMKQVVNLFDEAGALPARIHVELGRDLGKSIMERNEMDRGIRDRTKAKDSHRDEVAGFKKCSPGSVSDEDLLRYELYLEQGGYCPYSGDQLPNPERLYDADLQVDHVLPRSRSQDNGYDNKVLVFTKANQDKKKRTPYEWLSESPSAWKEFQTRILAMHGIRRRKLRNLLNETFATDEQTFSERNLNDTRYISRIIMSYLEALYEEAGHIPVRDGGKRHVFTRPGAMTSLVRRAWGLENLKKDLDGNRIGDKHHAVDALVCACLAEGDAQWISKLSKCYGSMELMNNPRLVPLGLETPWPGFRADVVEALRQITVSRRERCGAGGPLHLETIYRAQHDENGKTIAYKRDAVIGSDQKGKPVARYTKAEDLEKIAGIHHERSRWLKESLLAWIERGAPVDPSRPELLPRDPQGCQIRKVFVQQKAMQLRRQPQGHVTSGTLVRCDVFSKKGQYHLVPIYKHQLIAQLPPMRAIAALKTEDKWTMIDSTFRFEFSLWKNSRFEIAFKTGESVDGCYSSLNRNTGRITFSLPDNSAGEKDKNGKDIDFGFSTKVGVTSFRKISVDRLGRKFPVKGEKRTWRGAVCI